MSSAYFGIGSSFEHMEQCAQMDRDAAELMRWERFGEPVDHEIQNGRMDKMSTAIEYTPDQLEEQEREAFLREIGQEAALVDDASREAADAYLDHLLEKMAEREAAIASTNDIAERRILMIEGWRRQQNERVTREIQWLKIQIHAIGEGYDFEKGKKSRSLPNGSFGFRRTPDKVEIVDMDLAVSFAEARGLEIKKTVGKTPLKSHLKATGEIPDGCEFVPGTDEFFIKAGA